MGYQVDINDGATVLNANINFNFDFRAVQSESGVIDHIEGFIDVEGDEVQSTSDGVADAVKTKSNLVLDPGNPVPVKIIKDGVTKWEFRPENCIGSPRVIRFQTDKDDGAGDSHWKYHMTIVFRTPPQSGGNTNKLTEFLSSIAVVKQGDKIVQKIWRASAKGFTLQGALGAVLSFRPSEKQLHEEIERSFQENRVSAVWIWNADEIEETVEEPIRQDGGGTAYEIEQQVVGGANPGGEPVLHLARNTGARVTVRGVRRGKDPAKLKRPSPHYAGDAVRLTNEEPCYFPALEDPDRGIWALPYEEVYFFANGIAPPPDHGDHKQGQNPDPPGDGALG